MKSTLFRLSLFLTVVALLAAGCAPAAPAASSTATPAQPFRIALVLPSTVNDSSWSQGMYYALTQIQQEMGKDKLEIAYSENLYNVPDAEAAMRDYATKGYNLVIAHGSQYGTSLQQIAPDFPKTAFAWGTSLDTFQENGINNVFAYQSNSQEGGYVLGAMGALMSKSGVLGIVGPVEAGDAVLYVHGFQQGAKATKPDINVNVTYTGSFSDVSMMASAAETFVQAGADVLTGSAQADVGAVGVAKSKNVLWFSADWCQISLAPDNVAACQQYDWVPTVKDMIDSVQKGVLGGKAYTLTLKNNGLQIIYNDKVTIPADAKSAAEAAIQGIKDGSITVNP